LLLPAECPADFSSADRVRCRPRSSESGRTVGGRFKFIRSENSRSEKNRQTEKKSFFNEKKNFTRVSKTAIS
jgi:hypothetical protein